MVTSEERREGLRAQTRQSHRERGQRGLRTTLHEQILRSFPKEVKWGELSSGRDLNEFDIVPFLITQGWFADLRTFSGKKSEAKRVVGHLSYKLEVPVHRRVGPNNEDWLCLYEAFGENCPMCEDKFAEFDKSKNDQDKDKISSLNPSWRCFYDVYDYNNVELNIHPIEISYKLFEEPLMEEIEMDDDELLCPWDLEEGNTIEFKGREKKIGQGTFIEPHSFAFAKRDRYDEGETLKLAFSFDKHLYIPTYDEVAAAYYGIESAGEVGGSGEGSTEPEEEATSPRERRRSRSPQRDKEEGDDSASPRRSRSRRQTKEEEEPAEGATSESERPRRERGSSRTKEKENECPVGGHFGHDCNELDECQDCPDNIFDRCMELQDKLKKEAEAKEEVKEPEKEEKSTTRRRKRTK